MDALKPLRTLEITYYVEDIKEVIESRYKKIAGATTIAVATENFIKDQLEYFERDLRDVIYGVHQANPIKSVFPEGLTGVE